MPKRSLLVLLFVFVGQSLSQAQLDRSKLAFMLSGTQQSIGPNSSFGFGIEIEWNLNDRISFSYPVYIGSNYARKNFFAYSGWPQMIGAFWAAGSGNGSVAAVGLLLGVAPESIDFYFPVSVDSELIAYFSAYGVDYYDFTDSQSEIYGRPFKTCMRFGMKYRHRLPSERWDIMPRVGGKWIYGKHGGLGVEIGLSMVARPKPPRMPWWWPG